jgi:hypothetical protein
MDFSTNGSATCRGDGPFARGSRNERYPNPNRISGGYRRSATSGSGNGSAQRFACAFCGAN